MIHAFICTIIISYTKPTKSQEITFLKKKKFPRNSVDPSQILGAHSKARSSSLWPS